MCPQNPSLPLLFYQNTVTCSANLGLNKVYGSNAAVTAAATVASSSWGQLTSRLRPSLCSFDSLTTAEPDLTLGPGGFTCSAEHAGSSNAHHFPSLISLTEVDRENTFQLILFTLLRSSHFVEKVCKVSLFFRLIHICFYHLQWLKFQCVIFVDLDDKQ